jgi:hypothetical protein
MCAKFYSAKLKGLEKLEGLGVDGKVTLKHMLQKQGVGLWTRFVCLRVGTSDDIF